MIAKRKVTENVKSLLKEKFIIYPQRIYNSFDLRNDLDLENNEMNILLFYVENFFHIEIAKTEEDSIHQVGDLSRLVCQKLNMLSAAA